MPRYFFAATDSAHTQLTKLFDFVWPTTAAMWNLRWQVNGFVQVVPNATVEQLEARFTEGAELHGVNLRRACIEHSWDDQKEAFARLLLTNTVAIYEGWIDEVLNALGRNTQQLRKSLQFPQPAGGAGSGVSTAIATITAVESPPLKATFQGSLRKGRYYALSKLDAMMRCYRFFKEIRNSDMHGGAIADQRLMDAHAAFVPVATTAALGVAEVPIHFAPVLGEPVKLSLRGIVGFSHIVLKIIATLDAELSRSKDAEKPLAAKWAQKYPKATMLPGDRKKRGKQIQTKVRHAGFPSAKAPNNFGDFLSDLGLVHF
jgi:hypothetical protein